MSPNFKLSITLIMLLFASMLSSCSNTMQILEGADAACGTIHLEGYATDSQGDIKVMKFPESWDVDQVSALCG